MNKANFEFNLKHENPWNNLTVGAKFATVLAGLAIAAASVAASIFMAGAALFAGAVFVAYQWINEHFNQKESGNNVIEAEYAKEEPGTTGS